MIQSIWRYGAGHWAGTHGLAWSFWINFVLIRILVFGAQDLLNPIEGQDFREHWIAIVLLTICFHGALFIWQVVGVSRAAEAHIRALGGMAPVWGTYLAFILGLFWVLIYMQKAWIMIQPVPEDPGNPRIAERAAAYDISVSADGRSLTLTGTLELGITRALREHVQTHSGVEQVILDSTGGNIYAARGVSSVIRDQGLHTLVVSECSSACTIAFIGGIRRQVADGARLGFHQYRVHADYAVLGADPASEQERDRAIFLQAGVEGAFIDRMFDSPASEMWFPLTMELVEAGVITPAAP